MGFKTPLQFRRSKRLRKLPANFRIDLTKISVTAGKITFFRWALATGRVDVLGESVRVGRRLRFQYVKLMLDTQTQILKVYHDGRLIKRLVFKLRIS